MKFLGKLIMAVLAAVMCCGVCVACYAGGTVSKDDMKKVEKDVSVGYFSKVEINGSADVKFVQGKKGSARIVGAKRLADNVEVSVKGETLVVTQKGNGGVFNSSLIINGVDYGVTVYLSSPDLTDVTVRGSGEFSMDGSLDTDALNVSVTGSGDVEMRKVVCDKAVIDLKGSGDVDMKQIEAGRAEITLRGSGDIDAGLNGVASTKASLFGSGDIDLHFTDCDAADCEVRGSGDIKLSGSLRSLKQKTSGSGEIDAEDLSVTR